MRDELADEMDLLLADAQREVWMARMQDAEYGAGFVDEKIGILMDAIGVGIYEENEEGERVVELEGENTRLRREFAALKWEALRSSGGG